MSIKQKFAPSYSLMLVTLVSAFALMAHLVFARSIEAQASNFAQTLAKQTADSVTELVLANDLLGLNVVLGQLTQEPGFESATITDVDGQILASTLQPGSPVPTAGRLYKSPITLQDSVAGQVIFVFDDTLLDEPKSRFLYLYAGSLAIGLIVACILSWILCEQITAPLLVLLDQAEDVAIGDDKASITVDRDDEIGQLQQRMADMFRYQRELEEQLAVTGMPDPEPSDLQLQRPERRMATLLVIEVVNSTAAVELLHPATLSTLLQQYQFYLRQASRLYRGVVTQLSGDRAIVAFDVRQCQDEHAFNAICCGQLFLLLMQRLGDLQRSRNGQQLEFHLAVHSGDVFFSPIWKNTKQEKETSRRETVIGPTVALVQELLAHAAPGHILVSELSYDLANGNLRLPVEPGVPVHTDKRTMLTYSVPADCGAHRELLDKQCQHLLPEQSRMQEPLLPLASDNRKATLECEKMDDKIRVGHPFYFPTQAVLVDDDPDFLEGISLMLNKNLSYKLFQSASSALKYVNDAHLQVNFIQRCYSSYKTGPLESDSITHIDIGKLRLEVLNAFRFQTTSTVIVDYSMPEMNGLEFLMNLKNPFIRKVLLTGQADMELAVKAFNQQLIDQFIDKHDPRLKQKLNATILSSQDQYFRRSYKLITDPILANNADAFLVNPEFQAFFEEVRRQLKCVEYYMLDVPHSGFLLVDADGNRQCLLVYTLEALNEHYQLLQEVGAPADLLSEVKSGSVIPIFDTQSTPLTPTHPALKNADLFYYPAKKVSSATHTYFISMTGDEYLANLHGKTILPYSHFLETNNLVQHVVH